MNTNDYNQLPSNQQWRNDQTPVPPPVSNQAPLSSGRDWQAEAVYGATHPDYSPQTPNMRPVPGSQATTSVPGQEPPHMPGTGQFSMPLPAPGIPAKPYSPSDYTSHYKPQQQAPDYPAHSSVKKRRWPTILITLLVVALLAGVGYTGYEAFLAPQQPATTTHPTPKPTPKPAPANNGPIAMATVNNVVLNAPADMEGFTPDNRGTLTVKSYKDASGKCNLQFGTLAADKLPGNNIDELVAPQLAKLKAAGATVNGPSDIEVLTLKDVRNGAVLYTLPTVRITFVNGNKHGLSQYSAVTLKSGERAFIGRSCVNPDGEVDQTAFTAVDAKAKQVTVTKQ